MSEKQKLKLFKNSNKKVENIYFKKPELSLVMKCVRKASHKAFKDKD